MTTENAEDDERIGAEPEEAADTPESSRPQRFLGYFVIWEKGKMPSVVEHVLVRRHSPEARRVPFDTKITFPRHLWQKMLDERLAGNLAFEDGVMAYCTNLGAEMMRTSRVRFSVPPSVEGVEGIRAFYQFKLRGQKRSEEIPEADFPADIAEIVRDDPEHQKNETFNRWYWRYANRRRDQVISEEVAEHYPQPQEPSPNAST